MKPVLASLEEEMSAAVQFLWFDAENPENADLVKQYPIRGYPTLIFIDKGEYLGPLVGYRDADNLRATIQSVLNR